jgi:hypothetical protein
MKSTAARKLAEEFINVLKYNPQLTHEEKILSLETRLDHLISDVEQGCEAARVRAEEDKTIIISENPTTNELIIARDVQQRHGQPN